MNPVIMPPQVAIGAIGKIRKVPRVDDHDDQLVVRNVMNVFWAADHRVGYFIIKRGCDGQGRRRGRALSPRLEKKEKWGTRRQSGEVKKRKIDYLFLFYFL